MFALDFSVKKSFCSTIKYRNGEFVIFTYAYRKLKKDKKPLIKLALVEHQNGVAYISNNLDFNYMAGWFYSFEDDKNYSGLNTFNRIDKWDYHIGSYGYWDLNELKKDSHFKYIPVNDIPVMDMSFIRKCFKYPNEVEICLKTQHSNLINDSRFLMLKGEKKKSFFKVIKESGENNYNIIYNSIRLNISPFELRQMENILCLSASKIKKSDVKRYSKLIKYLKNENCAYGIYQDYLIAAKQLGDKYEEYPHHLKEAHDKVMEDLELKESVEVDKKLKTVTKKYKINFKGFETIIPKKTKEFIDLGKNMSNCVGKLKYNEKVAKKESVIFALKKNDQFICCCEFDLEDKKLEQCYGPHNSLIEKSFKEKIERKCKKVLCQ